MMSLMAEVTEEVTEEPKLRADSANSGIWIKRWC